MKGVVIRIVTDALGVGTQLDGKYVVSFDPEANFGMGQIVVTPHRDKAKVYADMTEAMLAYRVVSLCRPVRNDGRPDLGIAELHTVSHAELRALLQAVRDLADRQRWGDHSEVVELLDEALSAQGEVVAYSDEELAERAADRRDDDWLEQRRDAEREERRT